MTIKHLKKISIYLIILIISSSFLFFWVTSTPLYKYAQFAYPFSYWTSLLFFYFLFINNNVAINNLVQVSFCRQLLFLLDTYLDIELLSDRVINFKVYKKLSVLQSLFNLLTTTSIVSQSIPPHPCQQLT